MATQLAGVPAPAHGITYRLFRDERDIDGMARANAANKARAGMVEQVDVEGMRHDYRHLVNCDVHRDVLVPELDGRIVGYARRWWSDHHDGSRVHDSLVIVDPVAWGRGVAATLLRWAEARHRESAPVASGPAGDPPVWLETWAYDGDDEMSEAAVASGYRVVRLGAEMIRDDLSGDLPSAALPDGFEVRPVTADGIRAIWDAGVDAFADSFGEALTGDEDFVRWRDDPATDRSLIVAAYAGDDVAGYVVNRLDRAADGTIRGLLAGVGTRPAYRRRGLARALVARSLHLLRERGATSAYLSVDLDNPRQALTLYESSGFRVQTRELVYRRPFDGWPPEETT